MQGSKARTLISDELSSTLNALQEELENSDLFDDVPSKRGVMSRAIPKTLIDQVGLDTLLQRLPESYQRALFSSWVASHFVRHFFFRIRPRRREANLSVLACRSTSMVSPVLPSTSSTLPGILLHRFSP